MGDSNSKGFQYGIIEEQFQKHKLFIESSLKMILKILEILRILKILKMATPEKLAGSPPPRSQIPDPRSHLTQIPDPTFSL